jgi:XRE family aerobic/anaerobic benzoate catabolism transcriptional regulator
MSPRRISIGVRVRTLRETQGFGRAALAKKARVSQSYLSQLEAGTRGNKSPGIVILQRLAKALGVPVTDLLS